jgi:hypothetical protein
MTEAERADYIRSACATHGITVHHDVAAFGPAYKASAYVEIPDGYAFASVGRDADGLDAVESCVRAREDRERIE